MKLSKQQLKRIIKEELENILNEEDIEETYGRPKIAAAAKKRADEQSPEDLKKDIEDVKTAIEKAKSGGAVKAEKVKRLTADLKALQDRLKKKQGE